MTKLNFNTQDKSNYGDLQVQVSEQLLKCLASGKSFSVEFDELKESKSNQQLKGYWRICGLLVPHIQKEWGEIVDKEEVSNTAKLAIGYSVKIGQQITPKSLTKATKEEMNLLIEKLYQMCEFFGLKDYELTSYENQAMLEYYNKKGI